MSQRMFDLLTRMFDNSRMFAEPYFRKFKNGQSAVNDLKLDLISVVIDSIYEAGNVTKVTISA